MGPYLGVVFQYDGDVHVDYDEHGEDEVEDHEYDAGDEAAAVAGVAHVRVLLVAVVLVADRVPRLRPTGRGANLQYHEDMKNCTIMVNDKTYLKKQCECFDECLEVVDVVEAGDDLDVLELRHAEDGEDEHDERQQEADVDEGGQGHHQGEDQSADALGALDQAQDAADFDDTNLKDK